MKVIQEERATHLDWQHQGVTPQMIDWFWSNMEKGFLLWHPSQHEPLQWARPPLDGDPIGSIHIAPQTWSDGTRQNLYIRMEELATLPGWVKDYIIYEHCVVVAGIGLGEEALTDPQVWGYRIHQWQKTDYGVIGKSSAIGMLKKETPEQGLTWADHCAEEVGNWGVFLPDLFRLYKAVDNPLYNPFADLSVEGHGAELRYKYIPGKNLPNQKVISHR